MKKIGIFYGSTTGTTKAIAEKLGRILGIDASDINDVADSAPSHLGDYKNLILATSTWGAGEMQTAWEDFIAGAEMLDLHGYKVALVGLGDETMTDTFCDAVGELYDRMKATGAEFTGSYDADGYTFDHSKARMDDGRMVGLVLDEVNHPELTDLRIRSWIGSLDF